MTQNPEDREQAPPSLSPSERAALSAGLSTSLHAARNSTKARVSLVEWPPNSGQQVVLKDGSARPWWFRVTFGRYQMQREWKTLLFLNGMKGVSRPLFRAGPDAIGTQRLAGVSLLTVAQGDLPDSAIEQLEAVVNELHARGVTHGDLHFANVLYDAQGDHISLTDWATASIFRPTRRGFKAWMWREWRALDLRSLAKIKRRYAPHLLRADEHALLNSGGTPLSRAVRKVGALFKRRKRKHPETPPALSTRVTP